jgi:hypothetical protein
LATIDNREATRFGVASVVSRLGQAFRNEE